MQSESQSINQVDPGSSEEEIVLFKFKRPYHEESYDQIKIHSKKVKPNPQAKQKATNNYKNTNLIDRQIMLANLFQKLQLNPSQQSLQKKSDQLSKINPNALPSKQFFLKRIQLPQLSHQSNNSQSNQILNQMKNLRLNARKTDLQQKLNKLRNLPINPSASKRIKYKIIDIKKQNMVDLGGQKFEYQDLYKQFSDQNKKNPNSIIYEYYVLKKGKTLSKSNFPQIILPQQAQYLLEDEIDQRIDSQTPSASESDSNREDQSDYEYPQEDYQQGDSDNESEGIIQGRNRFGQSENSDDEDLNNSYREDDQEEFYRHYQKRCKKQEQGDDQLTYLYNFKSKYNYDSDD